jgi:EmrB/QacA subfamily drug resistance transporter
MDMQTRTPALPPPPTFTHRQIVTIMIGLMLGLFLMSVDQTIFAPALPRMAAELSGEAGISWIISAYLLSSTAVTPIFGKLSDLYGRRIMLQIGMAIFISGSVLCALSTNMTQLIAFRVLQGIGGGALMPLAFAVAGDIVPARERGRYQAYFSAAFGAASITGPILGGWFADALSWRLAFWINLPIGIVAMVIAGITLKGLSAKRLHHRIDYAGAFLIVAAASGFMLVMTLGGKQLPWSSPELIGLAAISLVLIGVTIAQERSASDPMLPGRLFFNRTFVVSCLTTAICSMGVTGAMIFLPDFLQVMHGLDARGSGTAIIPFLLFWTVCSLMVGRRVAKTGRYRLFPPLGLAIAVAGMAALATVTPATPLWLTIAYTSLLGIGAAPVFNVMLVSLQNAVDRADLGTATSANGFARNLGSAFGVTLFGAILNMGIASAGHAERSGSFHLMFYAGAGIMALALIIALFLRELPLASRGLPQKRD